jgi:branched-chain amino acid transport system permease protein
MATSLLLAQILNGLVTGALYALTAFGLSIIKGLLNIPNFAHGALYLVGAYVGLDVTTRTGSFSAGLFAAALVAGVVGVLIERFLVRRLYGAAYLFQLLLLFGVALVLEQVVILIWGTVGTSMPPPPWLQGALDTGLFTFPKYLIFAMAMSLAIITALWVAIEKTRFGAMVRAGLERREMAAALGIDIERLFTVAFGVGAALAGVAGALAAPVVGVTSSMGGDMLAIAFVVVVLGGLGSLYGAILAGLIVGVTQSLAALWVPAASTVLIYAAMIAVLAFRPQGLFGER